MRRLAPLLLSLTLFAAPACSDDPNTATDTDTTVDTTPDTSPDTVADTTPEDVSDISPDGDATSCEHPCLNAFGKNDKSLCPDPKSDWQCTEGCCQPVFKCQVDADCATRGFTEEQCSDERFACRCNVAAATCYTWLCAVSSECGANELCAGGKCVTIPDKTGLSLRILERQTVLTPGATYALHAEAFDPQNLDIVVLATPTWSSSNANVLAVAADGTVTGGATAGTATITATSGDKTATIVLENVVPAGNDVTLIVRTELTWEPITGSYLVVDAQGNTTAEEIPLDGIIRVPTTGSAVHDIHILADDNDWVSWLALAPGTTLYLPIPKTTHGKVVIDEAGTYTAETDLHNVGIITGVPDYTTYSYEGTLEIVLTTTGLSSALFDFNISTLLGSEVKRFLDPNAQIPRVDKTNPIGVPGGIVFNLLGPAIPSYVLTAPKGHHRLWSLGGKLDINDIAEYSQVIFDAVGGGDLDFTKIVGAVFPLFRNFWSGYSGDVQVSTVGDKDTRVAHTQKLTTPMGVLVNVDIPALPALGESGALGWADGLFLLSGAQTADGFMVPLGLNGGADTSDKVNNPADGLADGNERTPEKDPFLLPAAPLHSGLQGPLTRYLVTAIAASIPAGSSDPRPSAGAATLVRWAPGEKPPANLALQPFLGFPTHAGSDYAARKVFLEGVTGADVLRLLVKGKGGEHWTVYGARGETQVVLPNPADFGIEADRFVKDKTDSLLVNGLDFAPGTDVTKLGRPGGLALDLLLGLVDRVSFIDIKNAPLPE